MVASWIDECNRPLRRSEPKMATTSLRDMWKSDMIVWPGKHNQNPLQPAVWFTHYILMTIKILPYIQQIQDYRSDLNGELDIMEMI